MTWRRCSPRVEAGSWKQALEFALSRPELEGLINTMLMDRKVLSSEQRARMERQLAELEGLMAVDVRD